MNGFTEEELKDILNFADVYTEFGSSWTYDCHKPLIDKIKSMIDNYCPHDGEIGIDYPSDKCMKCGRLLE